MLITLLRHCDRIKIACLAQLVNVIAPIFTKTGGGAFKQTIFYPFAHLSNFGRGVALNPIIDCPKYDSKEFTDVPYLESIATFDEENEQLVLFCVNKSLDESAVINLNLLDFDGYKPIEFISMDGCEKTQSTVLTAKMSHRIKTSCRALTAPLPKLKLNLYLGMLSDLPNNA